MTAVGVTLSYRSLQGSAKLDKVVVFYATRLPQFGWDVLRRSLIAYVPIPRRPFR